MYAISLILISFFLFASSIKITGWQNYIFTTQLSFFRKYGLNRFHMLMVGVIELSASLLLIASLLLTHERTQVCGALAITFTSIGAIYFHLRFDTLKDAIPAIITLSLSLVLLRFNNSIISLLI